MVRSRAGLGSGLWIIMDTWRTQSCRNFNLSQLLSAALSGLNCLQLVIQSPLSSWSRSELLGISELIEVEKYWVLKRLNQKLKIRKNLFHKSHPLQRSRIILQIDPNWSQDYECFALQIRQQQQQWLWIDFPPPWIPDSEEVHATKRRSDDLMQFFPVRFSFRHFGKGAIFPGASPIEWGDLSLLALYSECGKKQRKKSWQPKGRHETLEWLHWIRKSLM